AAALRLRTKKTRLPGIGQARLKALGQKKCATSRRGGVRAFIHENCCLSRFNAIGVSRIAKHTPHNARTKSRAPNDSCAAAACVSIARSTSRSEAANHGLWRWSSRVLRHNIEC